MKKLTVKISAVLLIMTISLGLFATGCSKYEISIKPRGDKEEEEEEKTEKEEPDDKEPDRTYSLDGLFPGGETKAGDKDKSGDKDKDKPKEMEEKRALAQKASTAINTLFRYPNILRVLGAKEAPLFADAGIYTYISAAHVSHNVLLITQDGKLTYDVMQLRKLLSIDSYYKLECLYFSPRENDFFSKYSDKELKKIKEKAEKEKAEAQKNKKKKH